METQRNDGKATRESKVPPPARRGSRVLALLPLAACSPAATLSSHVRPRRRNPSERSPAGLRPLAALDGSGLPGVDSALFKGKVTVLNVWSSWCAPCREEHPILLGLAQDGRFDLAGLDYKDPPDKALNFLTEFGTPFSAIGVDPDGRTAINWGVYGVPETFVIGKDGKIAFKHVGPLTVDSAKTELLPQIEKALVAR